MEDEIDLREYLAIAQKRWKLIVGLAVLGAMIAFFQAVREPKMYKTTATLLLTDSGGGGLASALSSLSFFGGGGGAGMTGGEGKLVPILKSRALAKEVAKELDIAVILPKLAADQKLSEEAKRAAVAGSINGAIEGVMGKTGLFEVSASWRNPEGAVQIVNKYLAGLGRFLNNHSLSINYQIIDTPLVPTAPYAPKPKNQALIGLGIGLFAGIFLSFLLEYIKKAFV